MREKESRSIYLNEDQIERIEELAQRKDRSFSYVARQLLDDALEQQGE